MKPVLRYLVFLDLVVICLIGTEYGNGQTKRSVRLEALHAGQVRVLRPEGVAAVSPAAADVEIKRGELLFEHLSQQPVITQKLAVSPETSCRSTFTE